MFFFVLLIAGIIHNLLHLHKQAKISFCFAVVADLLILISGSLLARS